MKYTDAATLCLNPWKADVEMAMLIMHQFGQVSELKINTCKSSVVPIRCSQINLDEILHDFDGTRAALPITYLGLSITIGQLKINHQQPILDRAATKMSG
jgi:hypothetical protein